MAERLGIIIGLLLVMLLIPIGVGLIQWLRTGDRQRAMDAAFSRRAVGAGLLVLILGLIGRLSSQF